MDMLSLSKNDTLKDETLKIDLNFTSWFVCPQDPNHINAVTKFD